MKNANFDGLLCGDSRVRGEQDTRAGDGRQRKEFAEFHCFGVVIDCQSVPGNRTKQGKESGAETWGESAAIL
jgi:hypothetical protein